jgi:hypothetical protein
MVQDITGIAGLNGGRGITVPFVGASADVREREVQKNLASRMAIQINAKRFKLGRDLYPEEIQAIHDAVYTDDLEAARKEVAARDLAMAAVPGLKTYSKTEEEVQRRVINFLDSKGIHDVNQRNYRAKIKELNGIQKSELLQKVPEYEDFLSIPPFAESKDEAQARKNRTSYFDARKSITADMHDQQVPLDRALKNGDIDVTQWRSMRSDARSKSFAMIEGLSKNPDFKAVVDQQTQMPTDPGDWAYQTYSAIEPMDYNGNGVIDDDDWTKYYDTRQAFLQSQPDSIRNYIEHRQTFSMTPDEKSFTQAQDQMDAFRRIPKWIGLDSASSRMAEQVLKDVSTLARLTPGKDTRLQILMTMPGLSNQERMAALVALRAPLNPQRLEYFQSHPLLAKWFPDYMPNADSFINYGA